MVSEHSESLEAMFLLKSVVLFKSLDINSLYQVLKISCFRRFSKNEIVIKQGERGDTIFVLIDGELEAYANNGKRLIGIIKPGETVGETGILEKQPQSATVKAVSDSLLLELKWDAFFTIISKKGELAFPIVKMLAGRLRNVLEQS